MTRSEHIRALLEEYAQQRALNESALSRRIDEAERRDPEIARLRADSVSLALGTMRTILSLPTQEARVEAAERMKQRGVANNAEIRRRLKALGLPEDHMEMRYRCTVCKDSGYVGDAPAKFCECFEARLRMRRHEDGSMAGVSEQNFDTFDINIFPEAGNQRNQMRAARRICEDYADQFPAGKFRSLLLTGAGGLGKTFLLNCIYARVIDRGLSAVRITAFRMFEAMRQQHVGNDENFDGFTTLIDAPLLLIDDLGTEPMMRNISVEYLFTLLNERIAAKRSTVIATNLTLDQLKERYGERVTSRLMDHCGVLQLAGKDLRTL
ncbi:MAG: ATP-binding protein [Clostridia bacterium]|nr:ATP-binding protein [Clostridia bacterium]